MHFLSVSFLTLLIILHVKLAFDEYFKNCNHCLYHERTYFTFPFQIIKTFNLEFLRVFSFDTW